MKRKWTITLILVGTLLIASSSLVQAQEEEPTHPVLAIIASFFQVEYTDVLALYESGTGAGVIGRAFLTAYASEGELTAQDVLDLHLLGVGWGEIMHEYGIHPGNNGLGRLMRQAFDEELPTSTPEPDEGEVAPEDDPQDDGTETDTLHPVAQRLAETFDVPYEEVMALHESGIGFGVIGRAYLTAEASDGDLTFEDVLELHQSGMGWGKIKHEYGIHPGGNGLGQIMRNSTEDDTGGANANTSGSDRPGRRNGNGGNNNRGPKDK